MSEPTDLGVVDAISAMQRGDITSEELITACLERIDAVDGTHHHDGDAGSINAWIRVYRDSALAAARRADARRADGGDLPPLLGVPIGLKDLYGVANLPVTASSSVLHDVPERHCDVWRRLERAGTVLIGHLHTHEFAAGGTTDQVGNPWDLTRSAGGSSGGSAAALAARMVPAATGTDTAGSLRIPSACSGTSTIKPTRGLVSTAGIVPLSWTLDHAGPMARSVDDCRALLDGMLGPDRGRTPSAFAPTSAPATGAPGSLAGARVCVSPRVGEVRLDSDVAALFDDAVDACRAAGAVVFEAPTPPPGCDVGEHFLAVLSTDMAAYHRRFEGQRDAYRPALREWVESGERTTLTAIDYAAIQAERRATTTTWAEWLTEHRIDAIIEPTIPVVAPVRGEGYLHAGSDVDLISLTHFWNWTGFPVVSLPAGLGPDSGLPVGVSLIGHAGADWSLLTLGSDLQRGLGIPRAPLD
jgi:aspartyl-tRNA(Asn)/glutamyl-tRNA(Gln) amidotransferase subunit A